jgi:hypothetical protein
MEEGGDGPPFFMTCPVIVIAIWECLMFYLGGGVFIDV